MPVINNQVVLKHLVSMELLTNEEVLGLISRGSEFKAKNVPIANNSHYFTSNLFFENSTRTHKSFEMAERHMGLQVVEFNTDTSSVNKGEPYMTLS